MVKFLGDNYTSAGLAQVVKQITHLNNEQKQLSYNLLVKYDSIIDCYFGEWNTELVDFDLKEESGPIVKDTLYPMYIKSLIKITHEARNP